MPEVMRTHISQYRHNKTDQAAYMPTQEEIAEHKRIFWERHLEDMRNSNSDGLAVVSGRRRVHRDKGQAKRK